MSKLKLFLRKLFLAIQAAQIIWAFYESHADAVEGIIKDAKAALQQVKALHGAKAKALMDELKADAVKKLVAKIVPDAVPEKKGDNA